MKLIEKEISRSELKKIMREAFEDIGLGIVMAGGRTGKYVDGRVFFQKLDTKIKGI